MQTHTKPYICKTRQKSFSHSLYTETAYCRLAVPVVPVCETEAWMLAGVNLLLSEMGTNMSANDLDLARPPETISSPKEFAEQAIRLSGMGKRYGLNISDLYLPLGKRVDLAALNRLASYQDFENRLRAALVQLNLIH